MGIQKPYKRLWRPLKDYNWADCIVNSEKPHPKDDYLYDERFACQAEMDSLVTTAHLVVRDLYDIFNYIEPHEDNLKAYSHRIYELFLRTATEFETCCKGILRENGYPKKEKDMTVLDFYKIVPAAKLTDYAITFHRWSTPREIRPFKNWNQPKNKPLSWYKSYNEVKHNRYSKFALANLGNLVDAVAGLLCILYAQIGSNMDRACFEGISTAQSKQGKDSNHTFTLLAPSFSKKEQYDFIWDSLKTGATPVDKFNFTLPK